MRTLILVCCVFSTAFWTACTTSHSNNATPKAAESTFPAQPGTPAEQLTADLNNEAAASFKVTYTVTAKSSATGAQTVTWYKDGILRQRFDIEGDAANQLRESKLWPPVDKASVFTDGEQHIVSCSDGFPATPSDTTMSGPKGACCEGSSTCSDLAANVLDSLSFPFGYSPSDLKSTMAAGLTAKGATISLSSPRKVAGVDGRCYDIKPPASTAEGSNGELQFCWAASGVRLYSRAISSSDDFVQQATSIGTLDSGDFDYPYAVYTPAAEGH